VIIGTIRALVYDTYQPTDRLRPPEWDVLSTFERVFISRDLSPAEHMGDIEEARIAYENAAAAGHPEASPIAAFHLGALLAENGDLDGARDAYQRAVSFGTAQNMTAAAPRTEAPSADMRLESPERDEAITTAALELGILLAQEGDLNGARAAYRHAVEFGHTGTAPWPMVRLALALIEHADKEGRGRPHGRRSASGSG
jgi:tetratricopeptide (TPR) repeat protein